MKPITEITDEDALKVSDLLSGSSHLSDYARIIAVKELLTTNKLYNHQTNISGIDWYRSFKYLELKGYLIDEPNKPIYQKDAPAFLFWVWNNRFKPNNKNPADTKWYDDSGNGYDHFELYEKFLNDDNT